MFIRIFWFLTHLDNLTCPGSYWSRNILLFLRNEYNFEPFHPLIVYFWVTEGQCLVCLILLSLPLPVSIMAKVHWASWQWSGRGALAARQFFQSQQLCCNSVKDQSQLLGHRLVLKTCFQQVLEPRVHLCVGGWVCVHSHILHQCSDSWLWRAEHRHTREEASGKKSQSYSAATEPSEIVDEIKEI